MQTKEPGTQGNRDGVATVTDLRDVGEWNRSGSSGAEARLRRSPAPGSSPSDITGRRPLVADILTRPPDDSRQPRRSSLRERWRAEVMRSPHITDSTRVLLLVLHDDMREDGYVSVPREQLAARLDRTERKVSQRLADAVEARLLDRVVRGQKGRTAVYRALLRVPGTSTLRGGQGDESQHPEESGNRHPESGFRVTHGGPTFSKAEAKTGVRSEQEPVAPTSEIRNEKGSGRPKAENAEARRLRRRAFESHGLEVPADLREDVA